MENKAKERAVRLVSVFCMAGCAVLIFCMLTGRPAPVGGGAEPHLPQRQRALEQAESRPETQRMVITEAYFSKMLRQYLPAGFPAGKIRVRIQESGRITVDTEIKRKAIEEYLRDSGMETSRKQQLLLRMLPKTFALSATFACSVGEEEKNLLILPETVAFNGSEVEVGELPAGLLDSIGKAANSLLAGTHYYFTQIAFRDGGIELSADAM